MTRIAISLALVAAATLASGAMAVTPDTGAILGSDAATIGTALAEDGFEITRYRKAAALIQVTAVKDGRKHFILVSSRDGAVISHKTATTISDPMTRPALPSQPAELPADLTEQLATQGYELRRIKSEGHELEAYARRDGRMWELKLDPATGEILRVEVED